MSKVVVVVPCYNEEERFLEEGFEHFFEDERVQLLFVDDGSRDGTRRMLQEFVQRHEERAMLLALDENGGKAEAVRHGVLAALESGAETVGYFDADLATPPSEMLRMLDEMERTRADLVLASRVRLLGRHVERKIVRHYLGRVFATLASWTLGLPVYDTQCGAKLLRAVPALRSAFAEPFQSRWAFDVELLQRLILAPEPLNPQAMVEVPLREWRDVAGSKVSALAMLKAGGDLLSLLMRRLNAPAKAGPR